MSKYTIAIEKIVEVRGRGLRDLRIEETTTIGRRPLDHKQIFGREVHDIELADEFSDPDRLIVEENATRLLTVELECNGVFDAKFIEGQANDGGRLLPTNELTILRCPLGTTERRILHRLNEIGLALSIGADENVEPLRRFDRLLDVVSIVVEINLFHAHDLPPSIKKIFLPKGIDICYQPWYNAPSFRKALLKYNIHTLIKDSALLTRGFLFSASA